MWCQKAPGSDLLAAASAQARRAESRAWGVGTRPASARFVPTEVTLPCAMLAVPAPHLFPQAACSAPLCTFTEGLPFGV